MILKLAVVSRRLTSDQ